MSIITINHRASVLVEVVGAVLEVLEVLELSVVAAAAPGRCSNPSSKWISSASPSRFFP